MEYAHRMHRITYSFPKSFQALTAPDPQQHLLLREERRARKVREGPPSLSTWLRQWTFFVICPGHSGRGHEGKLSGLFCALLCATIVHIELHTHMNRLTVLWIGFCLTGPISLCLDSFLCMCYFVFDCTLHACVLCSIVTQ